MAIKLHSYRSRLMEKLLIPSEAKHYINAALKDSHGMFFEAIKDVAQAHRMAAVAKKSGVAREALYRSLSKRGNPSWKTLFSVLDVLGLESAGVTEKAASAAISSISTVTSTRKILHLAAKAKRAGSKSYSVAGALQNAGLGLPSGRFMVSTTPLQLPLDYGNAGPQRVAPEFSGAPSPDPEPRLPAFLSNLLSVRNNGRDTNQDLGY